MNLIERFGYERAKRELVYMDERSMLMITSCEEYREKLRGELLEYRRQHNIFEIGDLYVFTEKYSKQSAIHKVDSLKSGKVCIRHATPEEIAAGRRL